MYTDPKNRNEFIKLILESGRVNDYEINPKDKDGSQHTCSITTSLIRDSQGSPVKLVGSLRNISARKQDATQRFAGKGLYGFIQKPYDMAVLRRKLIKILHEGLM
jgi:hypothetical protein